MPKKLRFLQIGLETETEKALAKLLRFRKFKLQEVFCELGI